MRARDIIAEWCAPRVDRMQGIFYHHTADEIIAALRADGFKILADTTNAERSWPEDVPHENGNYHCICVECGRGFTGHKRRVVCRHCSESPAPPLSKFPGKE